MNSQNSNSNKAKNLPPVLEVKTMNNDTKLDLEKQDATPRTSQRQKKKSFFKRHKGTIIMALVEIGIYAAVIGICSILLHPIVTACFAVTVILITVHETYFREAK